MDQNLIQKLKAAVFALVLVTMSACSSSQVDEEAVPGETAADAGPTEIISGTDEVPVMDASAAAPVAEDPNLIAPPESIPMAADPTLSSPPESEVPVADAGLDLPPAIEGDAVTSLDSMSVSEPAPIDETYAAPVKVAKKKKHRKKHGRIAAVSGDVSQYTVRRGDTLMKIAFEQYGDLYRWREIYDANRDRIQDPNHVPPGTQLSLSGSGMVTVERNGEQYLIKHGDTLGTISKDVYGTTRKWKRLWENNRQLIKDPNKIYAGFYLFYQPEGKLTNSPLADPINAEAPAVEGDYGSKTKVNAPAVMPVGEAPRAPASAK